MTARYDRAAFFGSIRSLFGGHMTADQVDGMGRILAGYEARSAADARWLAYALATVFHETATTMQPIEEFGCGVGRPYHATGCWGRGLVQLTWPTNYAIWTKRLGVDLVACPALAMTWAVALPILIDGMAAGSFTGRKLGDYFNARTNDPVNARRIINGTDCAAKIAGYHVAFLAALKQSTGVVA